MLIVFCLDDLDWKRVLDNELVDGSLGLILRGIVSKGFRYLLSNVYLGILEEVVVAGVFYYLMR